MKAMATVTIWLHFTKRGWVLSKPPVESISRKGPEGERGDGGGGATSAHIETMTHILEAKFIQTWIILGLSYTQTVHRSTQYTIYINHRGSSEKCQYLGTSPKWGVRWEGKKPKLSLRIFNQFFFTGNIAKEKSMVKKWVGTKCF